MDSNDDDRPLLNDEEVLIVNNQSDPCSRELFTQILNADPEFDQVIFIIFI